MTRGGGKAFMEAVSNDPDTWVSRQIATISRPIPTQAVHSSVIATARVQPAEARSIFTGKQTTMKPVDGRASRL